MGTAPHVVPLILLAAAAVPTICGWSSWASNHGFIATAAAFLMSAIAVIALITTPIAQDVTSADEAQLEEAEAASGLRATDVEPFGQPNAGCLAACAVALKVAFAWSVHALMGLSGLLQLLLLFLVPPETAVAVVVSVLCCTVQIGDSFSRLAVGRSLASRIGATRRLEDISALLDAHWLQMERATQLTADAIATRTTLVLAERSLFSRVARLSLRLAYRSSRDVLHLIQHAEQPWWVSMARRLNSLGYTTRQSPLKVLILILNVAGAIDGIDLELQRPARIEGTTEHWSIFTSISSLLIEILIADLLTTAELTSAAATAASASDFVRRRVRPDEFARGKRSEAKRWLRAQRRAAAVVRLRTAMAPPVEQLDIKLLREAISEVEAEPETGVDPSLVEEAKARATQAEAVQDSEAHRRLAWATKLESAMRQPPLQIDVRALGEAIDEARALSVERAVVDLAVEALTVAVQAQRARDMARARLEAASKEPTDVGRDDPGSGVRIDTSELSDAIREARECWVDEASIDAAARTLVHSINAQRKLSLAVAAFFGRLRSRATRNRRRAEALARVGLAQALAQRSLTGLRQPARVSDLLDDALSELTNALRHARACGCEAQELVSAQQAEAEVERVVQRRTTARTQLARATAAASEALGGVVHCSPANVERVLSKLVEGVAVATAALVERSLLETAEMLRRDLEEAEAHRSHARARLHAALAELERTPSHAAGAAATSVGGGAAGNAGDAEMLPDAVRQEAVHAIGEARAARVEAVLVARAADALRAALLAEAVVRAAQRCRMALEQLRSAQLSDAAADELDDANSALADALEEAASASGVGAEVLSEGRQALGVARDALDAHLHARDWLAECAALTRAAHRRADRGGGDEAKAKLIASVDALEEAVGMAKANYVAPIAIREAQQLLTRARATARLSVTMARAAAAGPPSPPYQA